MWAKEMGGRFLHPAPAPLKDIVFARYGRLRRGTRREVAVLRGAVLRGLDIEGRTELWQCVLYDCALREYPNDFSVRVISKTSRVNLKFRDRETYQRWVEHLHVARKWRLQNYYDVDKEIGSGKYSTVYRAYERNTRRKVAVKVIWKTENDPKAAQFEDRERRIMNIVDDPHIVRAYDVFDEPSRLCIVLEYMEGGMLSNFVKKHKSFSEKTASCVMRCIFSALEFLHRHNIVHRDVKPDNILCVDKRNSFEVKLADFGLSNILGEGGNVGVLTSGVGTPYYVAPEMVTKKPYGCSVDMWSCGVLLYLLLSGTFPFKGSSKSETLRKIRHGKFPMPAEQWSGVSDIAKDLVMKLLTRDPSRRATATDALNHPWMTACANMSDPMMNMSLLSAPSEESKLYGNATPMDYSGNFRHMGSMQDDSSNMVYMQGDFLYCPSDMSNVGDMSRMTELSGTRNPSAAGRDLSTGRQPSARGQVGKVDFRRVPSETIPIGGNESNLRYFNSGMDNMAGGANPNFMHFTSMREDNTNRVDVDMLPDMQPDFGHFASVPYDDTQPQRFTSTRTETERESRGRKKSGMGREQQPRRGLFRPISKLSQNIGRTANNILNGQDGNTFT